MATLVDHEVLALSDNWPGLESLNFLVVFGDSFSSVGYCAGSPRPSADNPLGIAFPGVTSCTHVDENTQKEEYQPNWVGHLVREINSERREARPLLVYDYAITGDTVARMKLKQVAKEFLPHLGSHPEWENWNAFDTLFVTWIGINDCTWNLRLRVSSAQASMDDLFAAQEKLYQVGARNFCFIDVPPADVFPNGPKTPRAKTAYQTWNPVLRSGAEAFKAAHSDATIFVFSSWGLFTCLHSESGPVANKADEWSARFVDGFHPSSDMHAIIARELLAFLKGHTPSAPPALSG
ncbi:hypothetical protein BC628DRAFT_1420508 [Trametes gibbosa]|nr:hypothetical protein BC628DRAFT_1420508 [Trametes gibbosa]